LGTGSRASAAVTGAVRARAVPRHPNEQRPVVTEIGRPPVLRVGHQRIEVLLQGLQVEFLEFLNVVELLAHRIAHGSVLMKNLEVQLVRPPVPFDVPLPVSCLFAPPVTGLLLSSVITLPPIVV